MTAVDTGQTRVTGRRIVQYVLDLFLAGFILSFIDIALNAVTPGWGFRRGDGSWTELYGLVAQPGWPSFFAGLLTVVVWALVFIVVPIRSGRTPAMALMGLRIVRLDGGPPSAGQHTGRAVLLVVDMFLGGLLGWLVIVCSRHRQRIGDHAAGTLVVRHLK
ncbi:RDD family protein [Pseudonocardia spinosispora]|uniref:RDD family protein n=1 Tax=Pseudonocardia spinosispora TaxID=103441 RepID=UPI00040F0776|nr:RDD family protein [Pseudonocardia spinosispora]